MTCEPGEEDTMTQILEVEFPPDYRLIWSGDYLGNQLTLFALPTPNLYGYVYQTHEFRLDGSIALTPDTEPEEIANVLVKSIHGNYVEATVALRDKLGETLQ